MLNSNNNNQNNNKKRDDKAASKDNPNSKTFKRLSDINQFFICFKKLDEEIELLRHEVKAYSVRRLFSGTDKWGLSEGALKLLNDYT